MRSAIIVVVGVLSGAVGAIVAGRIGPGSSGPAVAQRELPPAMPSLPPGWDPIYLARLAHVESQIAELRAQPVAAAKAASKPAVAAPDPQSDRERDRGELYQRQLDEQRRAIEDHQREAIDRTWSSGEEAEVRQSFDAASANPAFQIRSIDCRDKTCVADLTFPSPGDALVQQRSLARISPPGCHGTSSVLAPPSGDGPYDAQVVYYCR